MHSECRPHIIAAPHTPEWYAARQTGIGASEIAAAVGLSPWATPLEIYLRKRGELADLEETDAMRRGTALEPYLKSEWQHLTGLTLADANPPMLRHPQHDFAIATPDGIVSEPELLECKVTNRRMREHWGEPGTDWIPDAYNVQCQWQMAVTGADMVHVAVLFSHDDIQEFIVRRNDRLIDMLLASADEFWTRVKTANPPDPDFSHKSTPRLIQAIHHEVVDTRVRLPEDLSAMWLRYEELGRQMKALEAERDELKARVVHAIGENYAGVLEDGRMVRRKLIEKEPYTVTPKAYWDVRCVKFDNGRMVIEGAEAE